MTDRKTATIYGDFNTREAADRAIEHLVQELGIDRTDVFVQAKDGANTAGTAPSGGDAESSYIGRLFAKFFELFSYM